MHGRENNSMVAGNDDITSSLVSAAVTTRTQSLLTPRVLESIEQDVNHRSDSDTCTLPPLLWLGRTKPMRLAKARDSLPC